MSRFHRGNGPAKGRLWERARLEAMERDGYRCRDCGRAGRLEVHHIMPLGFGGAVYALSNLRTLCRDCHFRVHSDSDSPERRAWRDFVDELRT